VLINPPINSSRLFISCHLSWYWWSA